MKSTRPMSAAVAGEEQIFIRQLWCSISLLIKSDSTHLGSSVGGRAIKGKPVDLAANPPFHRRAIIFRGRPAEILLRYRFGVAVDKCQVCASKMTGRRVEAGSEWIYGPRVFCEQNGLCWLNDLREPEMSF